MGSETKAVEPHLHLEKNTYNGSVTLVILIARGITLAGLFMFGPPTALMQ